MALVKCRECGKEISDTAKKCVHCGAPLKDGDFSKELKALKRVAIVVIIALAVVFIYNIISSIV